MNDTIQKALKRDSGCPEISQLFEAMEQATTDPRRSLAEQHIQACPACQAEWSLFQQFDAGKVRREEREAVDFIVRDLRAKRAAERRDSERAPSLSGWWQRLWSPAWTGAALAMAALILAVGITSQWRARTYSTATYSDDQILRSRSIEFTTPLRDITQAPTVIQWKSVPGAVSFAVTITEVDETRIFYANVTSSSLTLPIESRKLLTQGKTLLLGVTASDSSARELARSGMVRIRVSKDGTGRK